jgi:hypothetical protein
MKEIIYRNKNRDRTKTVTKSLSELGNAHLRLQEPGAVLVKGHKIAVGAKTITSKRQGVERFLKYQSSLSVVLR